jgi:hypothetical protein
LTGFKNAAENTPENFVNPVLMARAARPQEQIQTRVHPGGEVLND